MKRVFFGILFVAAIVIGGVALIWNQPAPQRLAPAAPADEVAERRVEPSITYPLPDPGPTAAELPVLDKSDDALLSALSGIQRKLGDMLIPERLVRNIVVTVDNLPREYVAARMRPVKPVADSFRVSKDGQTLRISVANARRYETPVRIFESLDPEPLVGTYVRFYPLFQQAYRELGYPQGYFNDRLIAVIDHLLDAPEIDAGAELVQPRVLYEFADPELQHASAGQKIMMRIGADNAKRVKAQLKRIRSELIAVSERTRDAS
ncbi:DUF3014 domain-containing protein [Noviherbaspirillum sp. ST9]|uniref:DUF3014 domain-containing protein n=1 Tax=Noviherbaspirillum sp. ST9 TaxID=3401606 RepID=UPI003B587698